MLRYIRMRVRRSEKFLRFVDFMLALVALAIATPALAGPPYVADDPQTTDYEHFEIYAFTDGSSARDGVAGAAGIDFNYGAAPDLQLTAVLPLAYESPAHQGTIAGIGNVELAAKYHFLHQDEFGWDVAVFPRVFLPSASRYVGDRHASFLLPVWIGKNWGKWSTFGGGGCAVNRGAGSQDYCLAGWALTRKVLPGLSLGGEIYHQSADTHGGRASTGLGAAAIYDLSDNYHLMASFGPGMQNAADTGRYAWYAATLFTF